MQNVEKHECSDTILVSFLFKIISLLNILYNWLFDKLSCRFSDQHAL